MPASATSPPCRDNHPRDARRLRAEREAHADFSRALTHDVGHDAVDANDAEQQRDAGGDGEQDHRERHLCRRAVEDVLQRPHLRKGQVRVDRIDGAAAPTAPGRAAVSRNARRSS